MKKVNESLSEGDGSRELLLSMYLFKILESRDKDSDFLDGEIDLGQPLYPNGDEFYVDSKIIIDDMDDIQTNAKSQGILEEEEGFEIEKGLHNVNVSRELQAKLMRFEYHDLVKSVNSSRLYGGSYCAGERSWALDPSYIVGYIEPGLDGPEVINLRDNKNLENVVEETLKANHSV